MTEQTAQTTEAPRLSLITGATGLLGSHIAEQLVRRGQRVRALVRPGSDTRFLRQLDVELCEGDLCDPDSLRRACQDVDIVYHAAAKVGDWGPWQQFVRVTVEATRDLIQAASEAGVLRFLHISSISAYGHPNQKGLIVDESAPLGRELHRWSYYSRAKVMAENLIWQAHRDGAIRATVIRPSWLYGPRDRATMARLCDSIRRRKIKLIGDGNNRLNLVHAGNVAEAAMIAANNPEAAGQAYNCSNDGVITQREYFNMIAESLGEPPVTRSVPYRVAYGAGFVLEVIGHALRFRNPPLVTRYSVWLMGRHTFFSCEKARRELGWRSTISYRQGIPDAVRTYVQSQGDAADEARPVSPTASGA